MKRQTIDVIRWVCNVVVLILVALVVGCATGTSNAPPDGLNRRVAVQVEPWTYGAEAGSILTTEHYRIYTTVSPEDPLYETIPQLMEGAYTQYRIVAPNIPLSDRPMDCYLFGKRSDWVDFTRRRTGALAKIYLQIAYGAYALGDVFVAYDIGDYRTLSAAAHEGWHQFASRNFRGRLPAFMEEGVATLFEDTSKLDPLPRWNLQVNANRVHGLWRTLEHRYAFPLEELITLDAGDVIHRPGDRIDAFYCQNWAFIRYLRDGDGGTHRAAFERLLADVAAGTVWGLPPGRSRDWDKSRVRPILEHYLDEPFEQIDREYQAFCRKIAKED